MFTETQLQGGISKQNKNQIIGRLAQQRLISGNWAQSAFEFLSPLSLETNQPKAKARLAARVSHMMQHSNDAHEPAKQMRKVRIKANPPAQQAKIAVRKPTPPKMPIDPPKRKNGITFTENYLQDDAERFLTQIRNKVGGFDFFSPVNGGRMSLGPGFKRGTPDCAGAGVPPIILLFPDRPTLQIRINVPGAEPLECRSEWAARMKAIRHDYRIINARYNWHVRIGLERILKEYGLTVPAGVQVRP